MGKGVVDMKRFQKNIIAAGIVMFVFMMAGSGLAAEEAMEKVILSAPEKEAVMQAISAHRDFLKKGDYEKAWEQSTSLAKYNDPLERFKERMTKNPKGTEILYTVELEEMQPITANRVWIPAKASAVMFPGFYLVKEKGEWKTAPFKFYIDEAGSNLVKLTNAISRYYKQNKKLPESLDDLKKPEAFIEEIPVDPFSDEGKPPVYKLTGDGFIIYSLGPDSRDDGGSAEYFPLNGQISPGDIIAKGKITKVTK